MSEPLVEVRDLTKIFPVTRGFVRQKVVDTIHAVDGISFAIEKGETLALVGESGCGKSTTGRLLLRLLEPTSGSIWFGGEDITTLEGEALRTMRSRFQMIFQDPFGSLNPRMKVTDLVSEPLGIMGLADKSTRHAKAEDLLEAVGLGAQYADRYPHEFSGGQRQRIGLARALSVDPDLIVADEPVSALDVSIQAQVINLMQDLQERMNLTYLFISHDLGVVHHIADRVAVMYLGRIVETAPKRALFSNPSHPYTQALLAAIPASRPQHRSRRTLLKGDLPRQSEARTGCRFAARCPHAVDLCRVESPPNVTLSPGHIAACHFAGNLPASPNNEDRS